MWIKTENRKPENQDPRISRRRYMAYSPEFGKEYIFRCWFNNGFGCDYTRTMITGVTHYRPAKKGEKSHRLSNDELKELQVT